MPQVPYNPAPSVGPSGQSTPFLRVPGAIEEASGVGVARAVSGVGREISQAGDMLAQQALHMQHMVNETDAKNADVDVMVQIGQAASEFDALEGDQAVKKLPEYQERVKKIRQDALANMPNGMSRNMLDQSISRRVGFALVDFGHKAGTQAKLSNKAARSARVETAVSEADFSRPGSVMMADQTLTSELTQDGEEAGQKPEVIANNIRKARQTMIANGIMKNAYTKPELAKDAFDRYKDQLDEQHQNVVEQKVNQGMANVQSRGVQQEIFQKLGINGESGEGKLQDALKEAEKYIEKYGKDNPYYADALHSRIKTNYATVTGAFRDQQHGDMNSLGQFIGGKSSDDRIMSMDAIMGPTADPKMSAAFSKLTQQNQRTVSKWVTENARGNFEMSPEQTKRYLELKGQLNDPSNWQEFYEAGPDAIMKEKFPSRYSMELLNAQNKIGKEPPTYNNIVNTSIRDPGVAAQMLAAGISPTPDTNSKKQLYFAFRGALEDAQRDWQGEKKTPARGEDLQKMVSKLLVKNGGGWFSSGSFSFDFGGIPTEMKAMAKDALRDAGVKEPTEQQIARYYAHTMYKRAFQESKTPQVTTPEEKKLKAEQSKRGFAGGGE
jgi:hypothetical protein